MNEVREILNGNYYLYKDIIENPVDLKEHYVDQSWVDNNFQKREFYLARDEGKYVGFASYQNLGKFGYIGYLYIKKGFHRKNYGRGLMNFLEMRCMQDNIRSLRLLTNQKATWANDAYLSMGFKIISKDKEEIFSMDDGVMKEFYEENSLYWEKILHPLKKLSWS